MLGQLSIFVRLALAAGFAGLIGGCLNFSPFACEDDTQCNESPSGVCLLGYCAYPDTGCPEGLRYADNAGDGLGGECVSSGATDTDTDTDTDTITTTDTTSTTGPTSTTNPPTTTTMGPTTASDTMDSSDTGATCGEGGDPCCEDDMCSAGLACTEGICSCVVDIEVGYRHSCAIKLDGSVWCWGANDFQQLGGALNPFETTPISVGALFDDTMPAMELSATTQTCALREDMSLVCWGDNSVGQADPGNLALMSPPSELLIAPSATHIAAGGNHTCASRTAGTVTTCWGDNTQGELTGVGAGPGPYDAAGIFEFNDIQAGGQHSCGVTATGDMYCWGNNSEGQLGVDPSVTPTSDTLLPDSLPPVGAIAVGGGHTCARVANDVRCFGRNTLGQLGDGTGTQSFDPVTAMLPPALTVSQIYAGTDTTCALMATGELYCWGANDFGQLNLEPDINGEDGFSLLPVEVEIGVPIVKFSGGTTHSCVLSETMQILCFGTNTEGQIGDGSQAYAHEPTPVDIDCP